jgi:hypothetical protein
MAASLRDRRGQSLQPEPEQDAKQSNHWRRNESGKISTNDDGKHWVSNSVRDRCDREEPYREESEPISFLQTDRRQDPNAQPSEIENDEESLGPRWQAKQRWKSIRKMRNKLFQEMQTLSRQADQKDASGPLSGG